MEGVNEMKFSSATGKTKIDTDTKRIIKDNILKLADKNGLVREKARKLMDSQLFREYAFLIREQRHSPLRSPCLVVVENL